MSMYQQICEIFHTANIYRDIASASFSAYTLLKWNGLGEGIWVRPLIFEKNTKLSAFSIRNSLLIATDARKYLASSSGRHAVADCPSTAQVEG
jgi:hypothetical protein